MLDTLRFVRGAVADRDTVIGLTHFFIYEGRIQGSNGHMMIDAPLPDLKDKILTVPADLLIKAIDSCDGDPQITFTETAMMVKEGALKVRLPILDAAAFPRADPDPLDWETESPLLPVLKTIRPFISHDASYKWSVGAWINEQAIYATNNVIVVRHPSDLFGGTGLCLNLPVYAIDELIRIGKEPTGFGVRQDGQSITFYYADSSWLRAQVLTNDGWPIEKIDHMFRDVDRKKLKKTPMPADLPGAVRKITPFCPEPKLPVIVLGPQGVSTEDGDRSAVVEGYKLPESKFNATMLSLVLATATHIQFTNAEGVARGCFVANELEGIFMGIRR
jgi:hypothetical protein